MLSGIFAFVLFDEKTPATSSIARDPIGIIPLYIGWGERWQRLYVASEMKALDARMRVDRGLSARTLLYRGTQRSSCMVRPGLGGFDAWPTERRSTLQRCERASRPRLNRS